MSFEEEEDEDRPDVQDSYWFEEDTLNECDNIFPLNDEEREWISQEEAYEEEKQREEEIMREEEKQREEEIIEEEMQNEDENSEEEVTVDEERIYDPIEEAILSGELDYDDVEFEML